MIKLFVVYVKRETEMNIGFPTNSGERQGREEDEKL
jgi:hypothetical protein